MYDNKLGERIRERRELLNLSQEKLGKRCGTTKQTIFKYENSIVVNIPIDRLNKIAQALETSSQYLLFGPDPLQIFAAKEDPVDAKIDEALQKLSKLNAENRAQAEKYLDFLLATQENK